jgi:hypothetical protein
LKHEPDWKVPVSGFAVHKSHSCLDNVLGVARLLHDLSHKGLEYADRQEHVRGPGVKNGVGVSNREAEEIIVWFKV